MLPIDIGLRLATHLSVKIQDDELIRWIEGQIEKKRFRNVSHAVEFALQVVKDQK